ncbi:MAG TPA: primosomal protein N' [Candidatus Tumulicola sp.]
MRTSRFDLPLSYDAGDLGLRVGDVVRVSLGKRDVVGYIVSAPRQQLSGERQLKPVLEHLDVPRAFDEEALHLAKFVADRYICTLGEALGAAVLAGAVPHVRETLHRSPEPPDPERFSGVPQRLIELIWRDLPPETPLPQLLRHPEARRAGDRATLLRAIQQLVRGGALRRTREFVKPRTSEYRVRTLSLGSAAATGKKARALAEFVAETGSVPRADALLAGFSQAVIRRAVTLGVLIEEELAVRRSESPPIQLPDFESTPEQRVAIDRIAASLDAHTYDELLVHGVTGSGKTFVYIDAIARVLRGGGRAIVLVPEISLTPQTAQRFESAFGNRVAVLHSALSERERFDAWQACVAGDIDVVVGARSAVFAPLENVKLLVVDESHESSYKQDTVPRYHAVAVARERMRATGGVLVLGSATPSVESYAAARAGRIALIEMHERATRLPLPAVRIVDLAEEFGADRHRVFSTPLLQGIRERLGRREKTVLFVNRRGSGAFVLCRSCGEVPRCPRCTVSLAAHGGEKLLRCHYCDFQMRVPEVCTNCGAPDLHEYGVGTERVVEEVRSLFPQAHVVRMDSDTTTHVGDHARILTEFAERGDVLVGTQMVAKGLDFPTVTLAAVVAADIGLNAPDFRGSERSFSVIAQLCGRSGRARAGEAIVQTFSPEHPAIVAAAAHDYEGFANAELEQRAAAGFPPSRRLVYLGVISRDQKLALSTARKYAGLLNSIEGTDVLGPAPYPIARLNREWRYRLAILTLKPALVRAAIRERVIPVAHADTHTRLAINVDP